MNKYLRVIIISTLFLFQFGCNKTFNKSNSDLITSNESYAVSKFLNTPDNLTIDIKEIANDIAKQQSKDPFLVDFINKYGIPRWENTITSHPALINKTNSQLRSNSVDTQNDFISPIYLIPLVDTISNSIKTYILCTKLQDSIFRYNVFNKEGIIEKYTSTAKDIYNGTLMLSTFSALENSINNKQIANYPLPFKSQTNVKIGISKVQNINTNKIQIQSNSAVVKRRLGDDCINQNYIPIIQFDLFWIQDVTTYGIRFTTAIGSCDGSFYFFAEPWGNGNYGGTPPSSSGPSINIPDNNQISSGYLFNSSFPSGGTSSSSLNQAGNIPNLPPWIDPDASLYQESSTQVRRPRNVLDLIESVNSLTNDQLDQLSLPQNSSFVNELNIAIREEDEINIEEIIAAKITIDAHLSNTISDFRGFAAAEIVAKYNSGINSSDPVLLKYLTWASLNAATLKIQNPNWSNAKLVYRSQKDAIHFTLEAISIIGVTAPIALTLDTVLYIFEEDASHASLNILMATLPGVLTATRLKTFVKTIESPTLKKINLYLVQNGEDVYFGGRSLLRSVLGITSKALEAHHIIPWQFRNHKLIQAAAKATSKFHMNDALNGIPLDKLIYQNSSSHLIYNSKILAELDRISLKYPNGIDSDIARQEVNVLLGKLRKWLDDNKNVDLKYLEIK
jgi:hypothetical protein